MVSQEEFVSPTRTRTFASPADPLPLNESAGLPGRLPAGLILRLKTQMEVSQTAAEPGALTDLCLRYRREPIEASFAVVSLWGKFRGPCTFLA